MSENRLVVADRGWAETAPEWLLNEIKAERMVQGFCDVMGKGEETVGDAEVCLYLYTANLKGPINRDLGEVYIYLSSKLVKRRKPKTKLEPFMEEKLKQGLNPDEEREYLKLKRNLYRIRGGRVKSPLFDALRELNKKAKRGTK